VKREGNVLASHVGGGRNLKELVRRREAESSSRSARLPSGGPSPQHPLWLGYCTVELYTRKFKGLHENDFIIAAKINGLARANQHA
jgi:hypothetical protein